MTPEDQAWLTQIRHELHKRPEISGEEQETAAAIVEVLAACSPDRVLTDIGGHGVAAVYESGKKGPIVAIRCELDGLPIQETADLTYVSEYTGRGHLCGHDGHMAMVLGVAKALSNSRLETGSVVLIFQPAEETGKGAVAFRHDPKFAEITPDYVFSLHNLPGLDLGQVELCPGPANCASRGMRIVLVGKTSHAAAPHDGKSPAQALSRLMFELEKMGQDGPVDEAFALTTVTHANLGAATFGVSPGHAELWVTLRTVTDVRMAELIGAAESMVRSLAEAEGLSVTIEYDDIFEACSNDSEAVRVVSDACAAMGLSVLTSSNPQRFSEDFGQFAKGAKTAMFWLGAGEHHPQLHNPDYDFPDALIPVGTGVFLAAINRLLGFDS
ncbi:amidohydrolase [Ruegeria arenilitoris]|uniref:amidohydrolase n=1 Tax=Ruegeria arenilitoris TaxID=1173585 RepID=UPI001481526E